MGLVGEQDLALGFRFNAKGTIDCGQVTTEDFSFGIASVAGF